MTAPRRSITILMADDDADDRQMTKEAFEESHLNNVTALIEVVRTLGKYWLEIVELPGENEGGLDG